MLHKKTVQILSCLVIGAILNVLNAWRLINSFDNQQTAHRHFARILSASKTMDIEKQLSDSDTREKMYLAISTDGWNDRISIKEVEVRKLTLNEPWVSKIGILPGKRLLITNISNPGIEQQLFIYGKFRKPGNYWSGGLIMFRTNVGWPMRSLSSGYSGLRARTLTTAGKWEIRRAWELPNRLHKLFPSTPQLILPYEVLWLGFLTNTFFFGGPLFLLSLTLRPMKSLYRKRKGLCPHCAYNLRSDFSTGCPECGWGRDLNKEIEPSQQPE